MKFIEVVFFLWWIWRHAGTKANWNHFIFKDISLDLKLWRLWNLLWHHCIFIYVIISRIRDDHCINELPENNYICHTYDPRQFIFTGKDSCVRLYLSKTSLTVYYKHHMILKLLTLKMILGSCFSIFFYHEHSTHLLKHLAFITLTLSVEKTYFVSQRQNWAVFFLLQVDPVINAGY